MIQRVKEAIYGDRNLGGNGAIGGTSNIQLAFVYNVCSQTHEGKVRHMKAVGYQ